MTREEIADFLCEFWDRIVGLVLLAILAACYIGVAYGLAMAFGMWP